MAFPFNSERAYAFKSEAEFRRMVRAVVATEIRTLRPKRVKKWRGGGGGKGGQSRIEVWGVVIESPFSGTGITALTGRAGEDLTVGFGDVQLYNQDGTPKLGDTGNIITEIWFNWMNVAIPPRTTVMGNVHSDGTTWVKVAPCGQLAEAT